jgi:glycine hydroxymethyltransferase
LAPRPWIGETAAQRVRSIAAATAASAPLDLVARVEALAVENRTIHEVRCLNLNPATNTMSQRAEAVLAAGLGTRPSLGHPGDKYETGLEAIEEIEVIAAELAGRVFDARHAEVRVPSGAMANLFGFLACARAGDPIIVPPATVAGHITHHRPGAAGLRGLEVHTAPIDPARYTIDVDGLAELARRVRPRMITLGTSLNLHHHPVADARAVADEVGAVLLFDAAHLSGPIAGGAWPNPLAEGAHLMTMSTYKSLAGPPSGLVLTNDPAIAERLEAIAFPGLTANFDAGRTAALAITLADWVAFGPAHARAMVDAAAALGDALAEQAVRVVRTPTGFTASHALAIEVPAEGGTATARRLRRANLLTSAIGLPSGLDDGLRLGVNELIRWGAGVSDMADVADLVARALDADRPEDLADEVTALRARFDTIHFAARDEAPTDAATVVRAGAPANSIPG